MIFHGALIQRFLIDDKSIKQNPTHPDINAIPQMCDFGALERRSMTMEGYYHPVKMLILDFQSSNSSSGSTNKNRPGRSDSSTSARTFKVQIVV
jgi:hypothetical protein